jgi:protease-4
VTQDGNNQFLQGSAEAAYNQAYAQYGEGAPAGAPGAAGSSTPVTPSPYAQAAAVHAPAQKKSHGWIVAVVCICAVLVFACVSMVSCTAALGDAFSPLSALEGTSEVYIDGPSVAVIELDGEIAYDGSVCSPEGLKSALDECAANDNIVGVILRVNSGGGTSTAGEEMARYVSEFEKPIVVSCAASNCSAAYLISAQTDYIFVNNTSLIGGIGVAMVYTSYQDLYEKLGIDVESITSSESKDSTYGYRSLTDEERQWYQNQVDQDFTYFINAVADGRGMAESDVRELANGLTYTGSEAVENGLADQIGNLEDAFDKIEDITGYDDLTLVNLTDSSTDLSSLLNILGQSSTNSELRELLNKLGEN